MREFKITEEQIKYPGRFGDARDHLIRMFPAAFEPEWEEVPLSSFTLSQCSDGYFLVDERSGRFGFGFGMPLQISINQKSSYKDNYRLEDGKIWRRKP